MSDVLRVFVEKRPGFAVEAQQVLADLRDHLGIRGLEALRLANRYDLQGVTPAEAEAARGTVLSEPNQDIVYNEEWPLPEGFTVFAVEFLPGQYDQRADSAAQCIQMLTQGEVPRVQNARVYAVQGDLSEQDILRIQKYLVNPVESRLAGLEKPKTLDATAGVPDNVATVDGFTALDDGSIRTFWGEMGFAMSCEDLLFCRDYFKREEMRDPTVTELKVIDTYWSDHCRHTTFLTELTEIAIEKSEVTAAVEEALALYFDARREVYGERDKTVCLMDMATIGAKLLHKRGQVPDLDESEEINACSIEVKIEVDGKPQTWLVQFKNETHNHPTEIEPFGGAATCLGGAIRDPLSGRAYVYQAMRVTGSGDPTGPIENTLPAKLPQRKITTGAAAGYSSYGNQIGLATGQVVELYDPGYVAKRMEIGAVIGASPKENVRRGVPEPGDVIVLLGGRTGRDGIGGATGSSKAHTDASIENGAEVQKGNPPTERKLQRLFRNPAVSRMIKRCNDFGAGGVCVAIGELADGLRITLDNVPRKYEGLDGTELAISESQERMAVVLESDDVDVFIDAADTENLEATPVAVVTEDARLCMLWRDEVIVDLSRDFLNTNGVTQQASAAIAAPDACGDYREILPEEVRDKPFAEAMQANCSRLNVCSQKGLVERFDASIGVGTVLMPFAGRYQLTPEEAMVAKLPLLAGETDDATAMSYGFIPGISKWSPFHGAAWAVVESLSKLAAVGADPFTARLTFQEYFEKLHDIPARWGKPAAALLGAFVAQMKLGVPSIGGKDSMSGSFNEMDVPPTLVSFAVAPTKASRTVSAALQQAGSKLVFVKLPAQNGLPDWDGVKTALSAVYEAILAGAVRSCGVVREGGAAAAVARMAFGNRIGVRLCETLSPEQIYTPQAGSLLLEMADPAVLPAGIGVVIGETISEPAIMLGVESIGLQPLCAAWMRTLEPVFPVHAEEVPAIEVDIPQDSVRGVSVAASRVARPRVFIPVFPGTNCEVDTARAFERAGAVPQILVVNNLTSYGIEQTLKRMAEMIRESQIVMIPGGFSGGDEPDGSGKMIATAFRNPLVAEAVAELMEERDGLMLGICNGFQALIKLGLLPFGKIKKIEPDDPTLTFNSLRYVSRMVYTRTASVRSPWLANCEVGDVHTVPVAHGEGRFVADAATVQALAENGQIAFQYCDPNGVPSRDIAWNPNGSVCAVEGILSPDGRILGKMAHSERRGTDLYKNVPGEKNQGLFEAGVAYFKG